MIAQDVLSVNWMDARDRQLMNDLVKRASKALRALAEKGRVRKGSDAHGNVVWSRAAYVARDLLIRR